MEWVRGQVWRVLPQPPPLSINCPKYLSRNNKEVDKGETREDGKLNKVATHGFFPHRPRFDIPHPLSFGIMPVSFNVALPQLVVVFF